ncbi:MAG TPA: OmpH family outer membrane protein [Phycisphaerae bacterium]|nr:OmpH family outer membrane protein [Phycisphaerae bacterium]
MNVRIKRPVAGLLAIAAIVTVAVTTLTSGQPNTPASPAGESRIAVVDLVRIFNECAQILDLNDMIRSMNDDYSKEAAQRKKAIEDKQAELGAFKPGTNDYEVRKKNLIRMNIEANVWLKVKEQEIDQLKFDWTRVVYEKSLQAIAELGKEKGYDAVLQKMEFKPLEIEQNVQNLRRLIQDRAVLYHNPEVDITEKVIQRMNAAYKSAGGKASLIAAPPGSSAKNPAAPGATPIP